MASILMPQRKSRSRKWHQFWCHRRKMAPIWSLVYQATGRWLRFGAKNKYFWGKRIKTGFSCSTTWGTKISTRNFWRFSMATFWGRKKKVYQSGLVLALPDAYQMGENFSKPFIKSAFSCSTTWEGKFFAAKARFLVILVAYLLREEKNFFQKA